MLKEWVWLRIGQLNYDFDNSLRVSYAKVLKLRYVVAKSSEQKIKQICRQKISFLNLGTAKMKKKETIEYNRDKRAVAAV